MGLSAEQRIGGYRIVLPQPPSASCAAPNFPDETCTGFAPTGVTLTASGSITTSSNGQVIDSKDVTGCITVNHTNVIIKRSRVSCTTGINAILSNSTGLVIQDTYIDCNDYAGSMGVKENNWSGYRLEIVRCENGAWAGDNTILEDSYIHDILPYDETDCLDDPPGTDTDPCHTDGVQSGFDQSNIVIRHNRIYGEYRGGAQFGNSAMTAGGTVHNYLFTGNLVAGGGYTARCEVSGTVSNYSVTNNRFSTIFTSTVGGFGPQGECSLHGITFTGNVCHETGLALSTCGD